MIKSHVFYLVRAHSQSHFPPFQSKAVTGSLGLSLTHCLARWAGKQGKKTELSGRISPVTTLEQAGRMSGTGDFCYLSATLALGKGRQKNGPRLESELRLGKGECEGNWSSRICTGMWIGQKLEVCCLVWGQNRTTREIPAREGGRRGFRLRGHVYSWPIRIDVQQNPSQYCNITILQVK